MFIILFLLLGKDSDPSKFESYTRWDYPLELTQWNLDPYPNGVQDLPAEVKTELREGGKAKLVVDPVQRSPFIWKSSQDLTYELSHSMHLNYFRRFFSLLLHQIFYSSIHNAFR